ncbi:unnamed protein product [Ilex paraguariensis]|uniref:Uncharacterized protein n=1 Tax=Ilex paraguariensis TaxID=185542 RepID=A0ABC8V3E6_9AQUA
MVGIGGDELESLLSKETGLGEKNIKLEGGDLSLYLLLIEAAGRALNWWPYELAVGVVSTGSEMTTEERVRVEIMKELHIERERKGLHCRYSRLCRAEGPQVDVSAALLGLSSWIGTLHC